MRLQSQLLFSRTLVWLAFPFCGLSLIAGCGDGKLGTYPVHGAVNVDSKPAVGVVVFFAPVSPSEELKNIRPMGITGTDGKFELTTKQKGDGAPGGQYKVVMMWPASGAPGQDGSIQMGPDRFKNRYMDLEKSEFRAEVKSGSNDLPPFELKSH